MDEQKKELIKKMGFEKELERIEKGNCPFCGQSIDPDGFRDPLSKRESEISGMCQKCQDDTFGDETKIPENQINLIGEPSVFEDRLRDENSSYISRCLHCGNDIHTPCPKCGRDLRGEQTCCWKCYPCAKEFKESLDGIE